MPKLTGITRETSETNPMQSIFTPTYDTVIPDNKTLNYYWTIYGNPIGTSGSTGAWYEKDSAGKVYSGDNSTTSRTLTHTFSQSGNYVMLLKITSDKFSNGTDNNIEMPTATGVENVLNFELNQQVHILMLL